MRALLASIICFQLIFPATLFADTSSQFPLTDAIMLSVEKELEQSAARIPNIEERRAEIEASLKKTRARIEEKEEALSYNWGVAEDPKTLADRTTKLALEAKAISERLKALGAEENSNAVSPYRSAYADEILKAKQDLERINGDLQDCLIEVALMKGIQEHQDKSRTIVSAKSNLGVLLKTAPFFLTFVGETIAKYLLALTFGAVLLGLSVNIWNVGKLEAVAVGLFGIAMSILTFKSATTSTHIAAEGLFDSHEQSLLKRLGYGAMSGPVTPVLIIIEALSRALSQSIERTRYDRLIAKGLKGSEDVLAALTAYMGQSGCAFASKEALTGEPVKFRIALPGDSKIKKRIATEPKVKTRIATDPPAEQILHHEEELVAPMKPKVMQSK